MEKKFTEEGDFKYAEIGEGQPIVILHGLMGGLSNFAGVADFFPKEGYKVIIPRGFSSYEKSMRKAIRYLAILKTNKS